MHPTLRGFSARVSRNGEFQQADSGKEKTERERERGNVLSYFGASVEKISYNARERERERERVCAGSVVCSASSSPGCTSFGLKHSTTGAAQTRTHTVTARLSLFSILLDSFCPSAHQQVLQQNALLLLLLRAS